MIPKKTQKYTRDSIYIKIPGEQFLPTCLTCQTKSDHTSDIETLLGIWISPKGFGAT